MRRLLIVKLNKAFIPLLIIALPFLTTNIDRLLARSRCLFRGLMHVILGPTGITMSCVLLQLVL